MSTQRVSTITSASKGIGYATAQSLDKSGHHVIGLARKVPQNFPGEFIEVDLADKQTTANIAIDIVNRHNVTHLINNLGLVCVGEIGEVDLDDLTAVLDLNQ
jgi:short-subunit dehydrogenase